ncbi:MAG: hypothetical protein AAFQ94_09150 [Bacteroidota bacterium]
MLILKSTHEKEVADLQDEIRLLEESNLKLSHRSKAIEDGFVNMDQIIREKQFVIIGQRGLTLLLLSVLLYVYWKYVS